MIALDRLRRQQQALLARPLGVPMQVERLWASQVAALSHGAALSRLPVDVAAHAAAGPLQDDTGQPLFMFGLSAFRTTAGGDGSSQDPFG